VRVVIAMVRLRLRGRIGQVADAGDDFGRLRPVRSVRFARITRFSADRFRQHGDVRLASSEEGLGWRARASS